MDHHSAAGYSGVDVDFRLIPNFPVYWFRASNAIAWVTSSTRVVLGIQPLRNVLMPNNNESAQIDFPLSPSLSMPGI